VTQKDSKRKVGAKVESKENHHICEIFNHMGAMRYSRGWSQHDMAAKTGISQSQIGPLEKGHTESITRLDSYIQAYAKAFGVSNEIVIGTNKNINHLNDDVQKFILNPANAGALKKLWMEHEIKRMQEELNSTE
jgi:transcriptional regulator with XRE-family HTH domain